LSMDDFVLRSETGGLTNEHVIKAMKAIRSRQHQRKESQPQATESKHAVA